LQCRGHGGDAGGDILETCILQCSYLNLDIYLPQYIACWLLYDYDDYIYTYIYIYIYIASKNVITDTSIYIYINISTLI